MIISLLKSRARSPEDAQHVCRLFYQSFALHHAPGWLQGDCLTNIYDRAEVLIMEHWGARSALEAWRQSSARNNLRDQTAPYLEREWVESEYEN